MTSSPESLRVTARATPAPREEVPWRVTLALCLGAGLRRLRFLGFGYSRARLALGSGNACSALNRHVSMGSHSSVTPLT